LLSSRILSLKWGMRAQRPVEKVGSHFHNVLPNRKPSG
jgi:hypothetical protein